MFNENQHQLLQRHLDGSRVKTRQQGNITLSYLEGYDIIDTANAIFGFGNWRYEIKHLEQISEEINGNDHIVVGYKAIVGVTVLDAAHQHFVLREDVGFGTGIAKDYATAHEGAGKEAVTDALKRAFRTFGNQFGNALYDKTQKNVDHTTQPSMPQNPKRPTLQNPYAKLKQLGLEVVESHGERIVKGQTYGKQQQLKALGFRWDASRRVWYQRLMEAA